MLEQFFTSVLSLKKTNLLKLSTYVLKLVWSNEENEDNSLYKFPTA